MSMFWHTIECYVYVHIETHIRSARCCILSHTTAIPHTVRQGDALVYYLCIFLLIWNILTRTTEVMECEQTMGKYVM